MADIRFGIIGLGRMGGIHAINLARRIDGAALVAAAVDANDLVRVERLGPPCRVESSVEDLLTSGDIDAVVIASPSSVHYEHISLATEAGKAIFCEKPLCDGLERSLSAARLLRDHPVPFQIAFQRRYDPSYVRAHHLIASGAIGTPEMFRGLSADRIPPVDYLRTSGGLFVDLGIHDIDAARFLMGDEIVAVSATGSVLVEPRLTEFGDVDYGVATLRFAGGALGIIQNAWRAPAGYDIRAEVHGSKGKIIAEVDDDAPVTLYRDGARSRTRHTEFTARFAEAYRSELQAFVDSLSSGSVPSPGIDDAVAAIRVAEAATQSVREDGRWIDVSTSSR